MIKFWASLETRTKTEKLYSKCYKISDVFLHSKQIETEKIVFYLGKIQIYLNTNYLPT